MSSLRVPLIALSVCCFAAVCFIVKMTDWSSPLKTDASLPLLANVVLAGLTAWYVYLTFTLVQSQTAPCVVVYAKRDGIHAYLVIENIGKGIAKNICFELAADMMRMDSRRAFTAGACLEKMTDGPLVEGIPALGPGQKRVVMWGQIRMLLEWMGGKPIAVTARYSDGANQAEPSDCPIDLRSLCFTGEEFAGRSRDFEDLVMDIIKRRQDW